MLGDIVKVNLEIGDMIGAEKIIRSGELFGELLKKGIKRIHRDTFHASLGVGRYALALLWYRTITKKPVFENRFCDFDEPISEEDLWLIKEAVSRFD